MKKEFNLMEVLSGIYGYLLVEEFDRIHELIEWVMGRAVFTHQIPDIADQVKRKLAVQFPQLCNLDTSIVALIKSIKSKNAVEKQSIQIQLRKEFGDNFQVTKGQ